MRILVVDDDPEILKAITIAFEDIGANIETAVDGNAAIDLAINNKPVCKDNFIRCASIICNRNEK